MDKEGILFKEMVQILRFNKSLRKYCYNFVIQTNGYIIPTDNYDSYSKINNCEITELVGIKFSTSLLSDVKKSKITDIILSNYDLTILMGDKEFVFPHFIINNNYEPTILEKDYEALGIDLITLYDRIAPIYYDVTNIYKEMIPSLVLTNKIMNVVKIGHEVISNDYSRIQIDVISEENSLTTSHNYTVLNIGSKQ